MAVSQYGVGVFGSPSSASEGSESMMQPNVNKAVPRTVWNAVGKSTQGLNDDVFRQRSITIWTKINNYHSSSTSGGGGASGKSVDCCPGPRLEAS
jgi:hypothetical protein